MVENSALFLLLKSKLFQRRTGCANNVVSPQIFICTVCSKPEVVIFSSDNTIKEYVGKQNQVISTFVFEKSFESVKTRDDQVLSWVLSFSKK